MARSGRHPPLLGARFRNIQHQSVDRRNRLREPSDVLKWPLLRLDEHKAWEKWFALAGVAAPEKLQGPVLNRASMVIDAAIDGQGFALARTTLAAWDLISRRIVRPFDVSWRLANAYW